MENINNLKSIVQNRFRLLAKYFLNRKDRFGVQVKGSALSAECESAEDLLNGHLSSSFPPVKIKVKSKQGDYEVEGNFRASSYAQDENGKTKWMCMDLDGGKEHKSPLADAEKTAVGILKKLKEAGVTAYLEKSRSGFGYHIWVFFRSPVPISKARALGLTYAPTDAPLMEVGKVANPVTNIGIEIFPKSFESKSDGYGNFVYFPWHYGAPKGANQFLELDGENLSQYEPDDFTTVDENIVDEKIKDFKFSSKSTRDKHYDRTVGNREFLKPDTKAVQEGCGFIKHCDKNRKTLSELEWFHLAGVFAALPNGRDLFHKFSKDYPGYSREETDSKFDRFSNATGPITCAAIEKIHESCASCPYFKKITTPIQIGEISSARELGKKMLEESKTDPGAPFLPLSIQAMHILREYDTAEYARNKAQLKNAKFSMRDLETSLNDLDTKSMVSRGAPVQYRVVNNQLMIVKYTQKGGESLEEISNFSAEIVGEEIHDDGAEKKCLVKIKGTLHNGSNLPEILISADEFQAMNWSMKSWGASAIIRAGLGMRDHVRVAIQMLSSNIQRTVIFTYTGWRKLSDKWVFLTQSGAIGELGLDNSINVHLSNARMGNYCLPAPPIDDELKNAILSSLKVLDVAADIISVAVLAAIYRAPLAEAANIDGSLYFAGSTGVFKTELTALIQCHFGMKFSGRDLPGNFSSTANALERQAFIAKDVALSVDDFCPGGSSGDTQKLHQKADNLFRGAANGAGRGRMNASGELRTQYYARGLIIASGEDIPQGHSLRARLTIITVRKGDVKIDVLTKLQAHSRNGDFALAMAAYVQWLAPRMDHLKNTLPARKNELREEFMKSDSHKRTPDSVASLMLGYEMFFDFAHDSGVISIDEKQFYLQRGKDALAAIGEAQVIYHASADPCEFFIEMLNSAFLSGSAYVIDSDPKLPEDSASKRFGYVFGQGTRVGWITQNELVIIPQAALSVIQKLCSGRPESINISQQTLGKNLAEKGLIKTETDKNSVKRKNQRVWVFTDINRLFPKAAELNIPPPVEC